MQRLIRNMVREMAMSRVIDAGKWLSDEPVWSVLHGLAGRTEKRSEQSEHSDNLIPAASVFRLAVVESNDGDQQPPQIFQGEKRCGWCL